MQTFKMSPNGERGKQFLEIANKFHTLISLSYAQGAGVAMDWYNDRLQLLCFDGQNDDPAIHLRLNPDGSVAEVLVRNDLLPKVISDMSSMTPWQKERDDIK